MFSLFDHRPIDHVGYRGRTFVASTVLHQVSLSTIADFRSSTSRPSTSFKQSKYIAAGLPVFYVLRALLSLNVIVSITAVEKCQNVDKLITTSTTINGTAPLQQQKTHILFI